jgi:60 kDa SS-A/Ro ribonucleoprotein
MQYFVCLLTHGKNKMRLNVKPVASHGYAHEGAIAAPMNTEQALRRSVMSCLLFEKEFYEDGEEIAARIIRLANSAPVSVVAELVIEARERGNLRHVPLLLLSVLTKIGKGNKIVADTIERVIQRADELSELLAVHAKVNGVTPKTIKKKISAQMKKGLARAFVKFDEYALSKYDRDGVVRLRDTLFLCHAKPKDDEQAALWKRLVTNELTVPDTWEVQLSGGADKEETFERLIREGKLGYLALLRNLRNMAEAGCDPNLVKTAIVARKRRAERVLPFRYIAAARAAPQFEPAIDQALCEAIGELPILPGKTVVLVDVSGSMEERLSAKSDMTRMDAAAGLGAIWPGDVRMFTFSEKLVEVPPRRGMTGVDAIVRSQPHGGTYLGNALNILNSRMANYDRIIVVTDEQSHDRVPDPLGRAYLINVASAQRGVGYGKWNHIDGFSEGILRYIHEFERSDDC